MKHLNLSDFHTDNYHLYVEKPDIGFSPERNFEIINQTITDYEKMQSSIDPRVQQAAADRADILASYGVYRFNKGHKKIEQYLGKELMGKIYGEKLMEKIRTRDSIRKLNRARGNTKFEDYY